MDSTGKWVGRNLSAPTANSGRRPAQGVEGAGIAGAAALPAAAGERRLADQGPTGCAVMILSSVTAAPAPITIGTRG